MHKILLSALMFVSVCSYGAVKTETVEYKHGNTVLQGSVSYDDAVKGKRPGVLVVHEWKGYGDYTRKRAEQLAALGYVAFAIDMYGKGIYAKDHEEAGKLSGIYRKDRNLMRARAKAGLDTFKKNPNLDIHKIAAIGYCFGGSTVLEMARAGMDVKGVASFHGGLDSPMPAKSFKSRILVLHGADDGHAGAGVPAFQEEMKKAKADWQMISYGGAVHSFTVKEAGNDPSKGMAYNESADKRSWEALKDFLAEVLK